MAEDLLFATLDPTMRAVRLPGIDKAILSDTVGFISDLPTQLVAAFRATLEEVTAADCIVHVRDVANPASADQKAQVEDVLTDLGVIEEPGGEGTIPILEAWNKADLLLPDERAMRRDLLGVQPSSRPAVLVSAASGEGIEALAERISATLTGQARRYDFLIPAGDGQRLAWLHANGEVLADEAGDDEGAPQRRVSVRLTPRDFGRYAQL
jgi:GTPase